MLTKIADVNLNNSCQPELVEGGFRRITAALFVALRQAQGDKACGNGISVLLKDVNYIKDFNLYNEYQPEPGEGGFRRTKVGLEEITATPFVEGGFRRTKAGLEEHPLQHVIAMHNEKLSMS